MSTTSSKPIAILAIKPDGTPFQSNNSSSSSHLNSINQNWSHSNPKGKPFETRLFYGPDSVTAAIGLGKISEGISDIEKAEKTRKLSAIGAKSVREHGSEVLVDPVWSSHAAAVGATLSTFSYVSFFNQSSFMFLQLSSSKFIFSSLY